MSPYGAEFPSERLFELPVSVTQDTRLRFREGAVAFALTPVALLALVFSVHSFLSWAAVGQPLSSPEGAVAAGVGILLLLRVGVSATRTSSGMVVASAWACAFVVLYGISLGRSYALIRSEGVYALLSGSPAPQLVLPIAWSSFPFLVLAVFLGALAATRVARHQHVNPPTRRIRTYQNRAAAALTLVSGSLVWVAVLKLAPSEIADVAVYGPPALGLGSSDIPGVLLAAAALFVLTATAGWAAFTTAWFTALLIALPALLIFPVFSSLGGGVATPGAPTATSLSLATPVVGVLALIVVSVTWALHWVQSSQYLDDKDPA